MNTSAKALVANEQSGNKKGQLSNKRTIVKQGANFRSLQLASLYIIFYLYIDVVNRFINFTFARNLCTRRKFTYFDNYCQAWYAAIKIFF
jgi:hypothetical protein